MRFQPKLTKVLFASCLCVVVATPVAAGTVSIERDQDAGHLVIRSSNTGAGEILSELAATYDFQLRIPDKLSNTSQPPRTLKGSLRTIIRRLLGDESYYIVAKAEGLENVGQLVVLGKSGSKSGSRKVASKERPKKRRLTWRRKTGAETQKPKSTTE